MRHISRPDVTKWEWTEMDQRTCQLVSELVTCRDPLTLYKWTERCRSHVKIEVEFDMFGRKLKSEIYLELFAKPLDFPSSHLFLSRINLNGCKGTFTKGTDLVEFAWWLLCLSLPLLSHFSRSHCKMLQLLEISLAPLIEVGIHHTSHFLTGFMALPRGQTKSLAKSGLLEKGP